MTTRLSADSPQFSEQLTALLAARRQTGDAVSMQVRDIIADVRRRGDAALIDLTKKFDGTDLATDGIAVPDADLNAAENLCDADVVAALKLAAERIHDFHVRQRPKDDSFTDADGIRLALRWRPLDSVGLYIPGGTASYPSSVLMNAIPAKIAGVERIVMTVPARDGRVSPLVLAAAKIAGVSTVYRVGGAQAIAALAFGTESIPPVDKITGPGNDYVTAAKRQVFGFVGIDGIAGPSEILVVADSSCDPAWIAADLLSQCEHDESAAATLVTNSAGFADAVCAAIDGQLTTLPRQDIARRSWEEFGAVVVVADWDTAADVINRIAPEHLELALENPDALLPAVKHAGAVFLGHHTPEAIGDYIAGPNHTLPTAGNARFASGLGVLDFLKYTTIVGCPPDGMARIAPAAATLAAAEGLDAHARSLTIRLNMPPPGKTGKTGKTGKK